MAEVVIIIEGIKEENAKYLFRAFRYVFQHKNALIEYLEMDGLSISLLSPNYNGISPNELKCREYFVRLAKTTNIVLINEIEYRREEYYTAEYNTDTKYILIVKDHKLQQETEDALNECTTQESAQRMPINNYALLSTCKNYREKLLVLLCTLKKNILNCFNCKIVHKLYLLTRYSSLCVLNTGYNLFYTVECSTVERIRSVLSSMKSSYTLYLFTGPSFMNIVKKYNIVNIIRVKNRKINHALNAENMNMIEVENTPDNLVDIIGRIEKMDRALLLGDIATVKALVKYIKKENVDIKITNNILLKLMVKGIEVAEKRYEVK